MGLVYVGELSIGAICPLVVQGYATVLAQLQAQLAGLVALSAQLTITPPTLAANLQAAIALVASLEAAIEVGLPGIDFQVAAIAALIASINVNLELLLGLQILFGTAGIFAFTWEGPGNQLGPALTSELAGGWPDGSPPFEASNAIILGTVTPATWTAMSKFFGGL